MRYFIILLFTLVLVSVYGQNDPKAKEILDKAAAKFKAYPAAEVEFSLAMENAQENINEVHQGKAWMKGNKYKLNLMDVENYYDGTNIYTYMPEVEEVNIKNPNDEEESFLNPTTLFDIHNKGFNQKLVNNTNGIAYIELFTTDQSRNFNKIGIWVKTADSSISKVTSYGKDGNNVTITINNIKSLTPAPEDTFFKFDPAKHSGVEIIDLR